MNILLAPEVNKLLAYLSESNADQTRKQNVCTTLSFISVLISAIGYCGDQNETEDNEHQQKTNESTNDIPEVVIKKINWKANHADITTANWILVMLCSTRFKSYTSYGFKTVRWWLWSHRSNKSFFSSKWIVNCFFFVVSKKQKFFHEQ